MHKKNPEPSTHSFLKTSENEPFFKSRNNALPEQLQQNLETSFNQDFSGVNIEKNSQRASELNSLAFAEGENIHFAPGQFDPGSSKGKSLIGHEFAHVVQQREGSVAPTTQFSGALVNDNPALEREADVKGENAAAGNQIASHHSSPLGLRNSIGAAQAKGDVAQLAKQTSHYGDWFDDTYALTSSGTRRGVDMVLRFTPGANTDAEMIGLTQTHQAINNGTPFYLNSDNFYKGNAIPAADAIADPRIGLTDEGTHTDRLKEKNNPIYGSAVAGAGKGLQDTPKDNNTSGAATKVGLTKLDATANATYQLGHHFTDATGLKEKDAILADAPSIGSVDMSKNSSQIFETTALALKGNQKDTYYSSVQWGWKTDAAGTHTKIPFKVVSEGVPSSTFFKAAGIWNKSKSSTGADTIDLPMVDVKLISNPAGVDIGLGPVYTHLPVGTRVRELPTFVSMIETMIEVVDGPFIGQTGSVKNSDLKDERP